LHSILAEELGWHWREREREGWVLNLGKENACEKVMKKNKIKIKDVE
jgi:hypothetical protein